MWNLYISDANESSVPHTFRASNEAVVMHNNEVSNLEYRNSLLEAENKKLQKLLQKENNNG